ncbi:MAG: DNA polymerase III subunit epsilon [Gammaproteobacteria bacterium]|nr:MAG: DNA polymerase III subunit epsilon [Gammaproteobacteria bacterium]
MRQVVLDTETTGLEVEQGHRVIEIGCVEIINRRRTDRYYHVYLNPEREIDEAAEEIHGISRQMLAGKPRFAEIMEELIDFLGGAELVIHNAEFDIGFLNNEIRLAGGRMQITDCCKVIDTLLLARQLHPGQRNSLDALCKRYQVDNSGREQHGALLDAQLLADVYLAMTGGQVALTLDEPGAAQARSTATRSRTAPRDLALRRATAEELAAHEEYLALLDASCESGAVWRRLES